MAKKKLPHLGSGKRFSSLEKQVAKEKGIHDPAALAASIGRNKYGNKRFQKLAKKGRK